MKYAHNEMKNAHNKMIGLHNIIKYAQNEMENTPNIIIAHIIMEFSYDSNMTSIMRQQRRPIQLAS